MRFDNTFSDRKPHAGTFDSVAGAPTPIEFFEYLFHLIRIDSRAPVEDGDSDIAALGADFNADWRAGRRIFSCILDDLQQCPPHQTSVRMHRHAVPSFNRVALPIF